MMNICLILHATRSHNLGVGALTVAQVDILRGIAKRLSTPIKITILDWADDGAPCVSGDDIEVVTVTGRDLMRPSGAFAQIRRSDVVVDIGAGDSFADIYGGKRLRRVLWLKALCHIARRPLVLAPQTFGPFTRRLSRWLARASLNRSAVICARDEGSARHLREIGVTRDVLVGSDVALRLPSDPISLPGKRLKIGINVSGLMMSGGYGGNNDFGLKVDYPRLVRMLIQRLLDHKENPEIHLVGHVICPHWPAEDDMAAIHRLQREFPQVICAPAFMTPSEAKGYIANMSYFTGSRMHACIAAFSSGVPVVPMAYSRKFAGLFGALGYDHVADCRTQSTDDIIKQVVSGFEQRSNLKQDAQLALQEGLGRLQSYEDVLSALLQSLELSKTKPAKQERAAGFEEGLNAR